MECNQIGVIMKKVLLLALVVLFNSFLSLASFADTVVYNTKTGKYHAQNCEWAKKCTVNCIKIDRKQAVQRGGVPCKVCGARNY